jgi:TM2 domain-containing membrane protein YozV
VAVVVAAVLVRGDLGYITANAVVVLLIPFVCLGLAGIHRWARGRPNAGTLLAAMYGLLFLAFGWAAVAVAGLGLVRFWTMRFRRPDSGGGMEG